MYSPNGTGWRLTYRSPGPVVGSHPGGAGRLVTCQYRLAEPAGRGDPAARAILGDLLAWAAGGAG